MPLSGVAEVLSGVAERVVARGMDRVADDLPFRLSGREFGRQGYGFMGGEDEVESRVRADVLAPVLAGVGAARFEQGVELASRGAARALSIPSAAASRGSMSGRQFARSPRPV